MLALQEDVTKKLAQLPRNAHRNRTIDRCVMTSRARGVVKGWFVHRMILRQQMDYNKMSGMMRARWCNTYTRYS